MRLITALVLLAIVGGVGYVLVFKRDWLFNKIEEGTRLVEGYKPAKTPSEAMEQFLKAVNARDYKTASTYCTGQYAEYLAKANDAARAVGNKLDTVSNYITDKGLHTDKTEVILLKLDPFPKKFKVNEVKTDPKTKKAIGLFHVDLGNALQQANATSELRSMDPRIFNSVLLPPQMWATGAVQIVQEGEGDNAQWKLDFPLPAVQRDCINHFINEHRRYVTALADLVTQLRSGRYPSGIDFQRDVVTNLINAGKNS
jgi:hypothetical protein